MKRIITKSYSESFLYSEEYLLDEKFTTEKVNNNVISFIPTAEMFYEKAMKALDSNRFEQAKKYLNRAIELDPKDATSLVQLGFLKLEEELFSEALDLLKRADDVEPNDPETTLLLAESCANLGLAEDAIRYANHYLEIDYSGEYREEALDMIDVLTKVLEDSPLEDIQGSAEKSMEQERARHLMEVGEFGPAIEILENVIAEYPDFWSAYNNLALAYFYKGEIEQARALLHEVLIGNYGNVHALCNLAVISYYEQDDEEVAALKEALVKIQPYFTEHRYKLGATLALIGEYTQAYKWLRSLKSRGYTGDPGFYFWLSHSAYFSGKEDEARAVWTTLLAIDPSKEGLEPWSQLITSFEEDEVVNNRKFLIGKLKHELMEERVLGLFLMGKSGYKKELLANPEIIDMDTYGTVEKLMLAYAMNQDFSDDAELGTFFKGMEVMELLFEQHEPLTVEDTFIMQLWVLLLEKGLRAKYAFKNPKALAAATEYIFFASREKVTKKSIAEYYGITTKTLTKYVDELIHFLPIFE